MNYLFANLLVAWLYIYKSNGTVNQRNDKGYYHYQYMTTETAIRHDKRKTE